MRFLPIILLAGLVSTSIAAPYPNRDEEGGKNGGPGKNAAAKNAAAVGGHKGGKGEAAAAAAAVAAAAAAAGGAGAAAVAVNETAVAGEEEAENANKIDLPGAFDAAIALQGGDIQQDVLFTKSAVGALEVEFQNAEGRTLTVTENKTPAAPPAGFQALEPSSFKINLAEGADALTLQKVDYVIDPASKYSQYLYYNRLLIPSQARISLVSTLPRARLANSAPRQIPSLSIQPWESSNLRSRRMSLP